jgi:hypothetical protein
LQPPQFLLIEKEKSSVRRIKALPVPPAGKTDKVFPAARGLLYRSGHHP